ncbi:osmoprotectant transport system ATP-binding protein [Mesobacillus persicus]|uniref:Quaternary amine transport ATP-binding protein n=1 Tax=Mesobacillus persicus TaxID=930146 RepID=A0A1H8ITR6_9BACI|nr:ABC transporter ATP-binding protein [Mesobacillus persicus]SEN71811.1 osmoprotectant transport system ATP-binding protein [Mesobacillus persicus]
MITFKNATKNYQDGTTAVDSVSFEIKKGEFFVLIGPSGCGKTTTLKMINRLTPLSEGTIFIDGKKISDYNIDELRWNIGYVLQQIALFPHMTIEENISIVPELKKWNKADIHNRVTELLEMVGLEPATYRSRKPSELSGGEQQRVGVIRALAADPDIILMDEPFSALDPISREKLQNDMIHLQKTIKKTIVFVTHDMQEAIKLADRICLMKDGRVVQMGTPNEIIENPTNDFVQDFVGSGQKIGSDLQLKDIIEPLGDAKFSTTIPVTATLEEILAQLSTHDQLGIEKDGNIIGTVNRQRIIQYFSKQLENGGATNA